MFSKVIILVILALVALIFIANILPPDNEPEILKDYRLADTQKLININNVYINVDIADEPHEQAQGLSGKEKLTENQGMLFIFPSSITPSFWMKDMRFALDMIWIDSNGKILEITKNISPDTFPKTFQPSSPIKYVLEVNAGWSDANEIKAGDMMTGL